MYFKTAKSDTCPKSVASNYWRSRVRFVVAVVNRDLPVVELVATSDVVAVKLDSADRQIVVISMYLPPEYPKDLVDAQMALLHELVTKNMEHDIIILGTYNAKS